MSTKETKYPTAIKALQELGVKIGGELYAIELLEQDSVGKTMALMFGSSFNKEAKQKEFHEVLEAIKLLQDKSVE